MKDINEIQKILEEPKGWLKISPADIIHLNDYCKQLVIENQQLILSGVSNSYSKEDLRVAFEQARCNKHSFEDWYEFNYC